jgi:hypothetical protein
MPQRIDYAAFPRFLRVWRQAELMDRMLERQGIDAIVAARLDGGAAFMAARRACLGCHHSHMCEQLLEALPGSPLSPSFCANADFFDRCRERIQLPALRPAD